MQDYSTLRLVKCVFNLLMLPFVVRLTKCQFTPLTTDSFVNELCRERWNVLDWETILKPCLGRVGFGKNKLPGNLKTNAAWSRMFSTDIKGAGEYSKFVIQTVDQLGALKTIGGDTWRILISGPSSVQPTVHDMNNGLYEIPFLLMEPGIYKAEIFLEGTLCNQFFDPPADWFKKGKFVCLFDMFVYFLLLFLQKHHIVYIINPLFRSC